MRFVNKLRKKPSYGTKTLTVEEKAKAEIILWSIEQKKHFHEKENSVHGLQVARGDDEVLRVKTRIIERDDDLSFLYPILLPSKHYLTECLIREYHLKYCHAGRPSTVYTDNATNVRGTDNALKKIDWQKISENECYPIKWEFNPPTAAWDGWGSGLIVQSRACSCAF
ncbi:reverse transcriptase [Caerostris darwini]|uniref:Reverse transcriptase n=1 Tax=Caerostris darwini TaxID=1538125 RepID=A0AAV4VQ35_9ARAC|nr:reverse transcriptase [Caerostris darwini]